MKKIVLVPDSFKGTMSSTKICSIMEQVIKCHYPQAQVVAIPVADGGEGSVDCFLKAVGGNRIETIVKGPYFEDMTAFYGILPDNTAVIEMAACAGLPLVGENRPAGRNSRSNRSQQRGRTALGLGCFAAFPSPSVADL